MTPIYLLDTNVVSELRRARTHGGVPSWLGSVVETDLHLAAVTLGEIQVGVESARKTDPSKAVMIEAWIETLPSAFKVLPMDGPIFRRWARLMSGLSDDFYEDAMIAATAEAHRLTVVTRNVRDFKRLGAHTLNPFDTPRG